MVILVVVVVGWVISLRVEVEELASDVADTLEVTEVTDVRSTFCCKVSRPGSSTGRDSKSA